MNQVPYKRMESDMRMKQKYLNRMEQLVHYQKNQKLYKLYCQVKPNRNQKIFSTRQVIRRSSFRCQSFNKYKDAQGTHYILEQASKEWNQEGLFLEFYQEDHVIGCAHYY